MEIPVEQEIRTLEAQIADLTIKIRCEPELRQKLQEQRALIMQKLIPLKREVEANEEKEAPPKLESLWQKHKNFVILQINGTKVPIPENLEIEFKYALCSHTKKMKVYNFIYCKTNKQLLSEWEGMFHQQADTHSLEGQLNCEECHQAHLKQLEKGVYQDNLRNGVATWKMRFFG